MACNPLQSLRVKTTKALPCLEPGNRGRDHPGSVLSRVHQDHFRTAGVRVGGSTSRRVDSLRWLRKYACGVSLGHADILPGRWAAARALGALRRASSHSCPGHVPEQPTSYIRARDVETDDTGFVQRF